MINTKQTNYKQRTIRLTGQTEKEYKRDYDRIRKQIATLKKSGVVTDDLSPTRMLYYRAKYGGGTLLQRQIEAASTTGSARAIEAARSLEAERIKGQAAGLFREAPTMKEYLRQYESGEISTIEFINKTRIWIDAFDRNRATGLDPATIYNLTV